MEDVNLDSLRSLIDTERERFSVPGCAVVVVADGEVVLAEGFGVRDLGSGAAVTGQTMFPIASDTKNFAAAGLASLAAEGVLDLDAPVRTYIPWFEMHDPHATALVSARDLLSHRTGLPRHDLVWYGERPLTHEQTARLLKHLPPNKQLRQTWQYNNLCYTTAGYLTEVLTGQPWAQFVTERFFMPLGMKNSGFYRRSLAEGDFATPYLKIDDVPTEQSLPLQDDDDPAGGAVSTAEDLGQWLLARLGHEVNGQRVLSDAALAQLHAPAMVSDTTEPKYAERQSLGYALGCQIKTYRGHRMVHHGGNLVGFSSDVTLIPAAGVGVAVLTNLHGTALRDALPLMIFDQLLGLEALPWGERFLESMLTAERGAKAVSDHKQETAAGSPPSRPLEEFAGQYTHPAYDTIELSVHGGTLDIDFHGLGSKIRLEHKDRDVWNVRFAEFPSMIMPIVFRTDADAQISGLEIPIEPTVAPTFFTRAPAQATEGLWAALPGSYAMDAVTVSIEQRGEDLYFTGPTGTLRLTSKGGTTLVSPDLPALRIEAELVDGAVTRLVVDPVGIFLRAG